MITKLLLLLLSLLLCLSHPSPVYMGVMVFIVNIIVMSDDLGRDPGTTTGTEDVVFSF